MKKRLWIPIVIVLAVLSILLFVRRGGQGIEVKAVTPTRGRIVSYLSAEGTLESRKKKEYYISNPAKVEKVYVKVGETVNKGDTLIELETQDMSSQLKVAELQYKSQKLQLDSLKKQRDKGMAEAQQMGIQSSSIDDQIKLQENQVEIARLNLESIKSSIAKQQKYIKADFKGVVTSLKGVEGAPAPVQMPIVTVEDTSDLVVSVNINQYDVINIKPGQKVEIKFSDIVTDGKVESINPAAEKVVSSAGTDTVITAYVSLDEKKEGILPGFNVDVNIIQGVSENALKIPIEAVITDKYGDEMVYTVEDNKASLKKIKTGLSSDTEIEIIEGISQNDFVILNPPSAITDNSRVFIKGEKK